MIERNAAFDRNNSACLAETSEDQTGLEVWRHWRDREPVYEMTMFWRDDDMTVSMSRDELKRLGETLVRLANATFLEPAP
jgi:hypothetical protein